MPKVVVRKSYRCQPGKRREVVTALQRIDAAAATVGYPRGRYLLVETRATGEPDLEVEFAFESYAEMEQLERRMREHIARFLREGGSTGQEFLLEPSATRYLVLVDETAGGGRAVASAPNARPMARPMSDAPAPVRGPNGPPSGRPSDGPPAGRPPDGPRPAGQASGPGRPPVSRSEPGTRPGIEPRNPVAPSAPMEEPDDDDDDPFEGLDEVPEPEVPPPPDVPVGMTPDQFQAAQLARARAALSGAENAVNLQPRQRAGEPAPERRSRPPLRDE